MINTVLFILKIIVYVVAINISIKHLNANNMTNIEISSIEIDENGQPIINVFIHTLAAHEKPKAFRFALDTCSSVCAIDSSIPPNFFWDDLATNLVWTGPKTSCILPVVVIKRMQVGGMTRDGIAAFRMNLKESMLGRFQDDPVDGILGMSFLQGTRFILNLSEKRMEWWGKPWPKGTTLPIRYDSRKSPFVSLQLDGREGECWLGTAITVGIALPWNLRPEGKGQPIISHGIDGLVDAGETLEVPEINAGSDAWKNVKVSFQKQQMGEIGLDVWSGGAACFDFVTDRLTLTSSEEKGLMIHRNPILRLPLSWDRKGGTPKLSVHFVKTGSPMESAGFHAGDEIVRVGPLPSGSLSRRAIQDLVAKGAPLRWILKRNGQSVQLVFPKHEAR
jgi:hypothetical protein